MIHPFILFLGAAIIGTVANIGIRKSKKEKRRQSYTPRPSDKKEIFYTPSDPSERTGPPPNFFDSSDDEVRSPDGMG